MAEPARKTIVGPPMIRVESRRFGAFEVPAERILGFEAGRVVPDRIDSIPEPPASAVGYIDSPFRNLKTSVRTGDPALAKLKVGDRVLVTIGETIRYATVTEGSFGVPEGELAFAPGSSGHGEPFWELFKRGGSAWAEFGRPATGAKVEIVRLTEAG